MSAYRDSLGASHLRAEALEQDLAEVRRLQAKAERRVAELEGASSQTRALKEALPPASDGDLRARLDALGERVAAATTGLSKEQALIRTKLDLLHVAFEQSDASRWDRRESRSGPSLEKSGAALGLLLVFLIFLGMAVCNHASRPTISDESSAARSALDDELSEEALFRGLAPPGWSLDAAPLFADAGLDPTQ